MKKLFFFFLPTAYCLLSTVSLSQTWNKVGTGVYGGGGISGLGIYKNELYYGGGYSYQPYINLAKWDGSVWTPVDSASSGFPYCFLEYNNELYVGGDFGSIQGTMSRGIAKWNGTQWLSLGSVNSNVTYINNLTIYNGELYAAGSFNKIDGVNTRGIAKWNGTNWSAVGGGLSGGFPTSDGKALLYKNDLYVGGDFTKAGNVPAICIARWNGTKWDSVGSGTNGEVLDFVVDTANDFLYVGGRMTYGNARWDGYAWTTLDSGISGNIYSLAIYHHQLYAVGYFIAVGGEGVARWNGAYWEAVGGGITPGGNTIESAQVYKDELYVGGGLLDAGGDTSIKWIARWYSPPDTTCKFVLQPIIKSMLSLSAPNGVSDTFYYIDSIAVQFYNNIASASSWQWNFGDGDTGSGKTPIHYYTATGTYTVSVIVNYPYGPKGPCIDTAYKTITVIYGISGVNELQQNVKFKVYPNPAKKEITLEMTPPPAPKGEGSYVVRIKNSIGQEILQRVIPSGARNLTIDTSQFPKGLCLVEVCNLPPGPSPNGEGKVCHTEKVVVE